MPGRKKLTFIDPDFEEEGYLTTDSSHIKLTYKGPVEIFNIKGVLPKIL